MSRFPKMIYVRQSDLNNIAAVRDILVRIRQLPPKGEDADKEGPLEEWLTSLKDRIEI